MISDEELKGIERELLGDERPALDCHTSLWLISALREARAERDEMAGVLRATSEHSARTCQKLVVSRSFARAWKKAAKLYWRLYGMATTRGKVQDGIVFDLQEENARLREVVEKAEAWLKADQRLTMSNPIYDNQSLMERELKLARESVRSALSALGGTGT